MKKNIIIALLLVVAVVSIVFSLYQKSQADLCIERAIGLQKAAEANEDQFKLKENEALQQLALANSQLAETLLQLQIAQEELNKIKRSK